ncbi:nuclear pore complex protein Nup93-1-like [Metopolophium dirhodum]|uniref:nuclear pore complex protein Nup93-1-like n=1 Tax=Metopolophium dirhodum TaxID=44670 RepID=UPI0029903F6F|nr:nuclear pore complex protein Nup93-1-like [Metopolophium dirhodum]XP_060858936.1 nuclear pore complex protein Nup93-1-like [Metopolophium dirhodum]XP_060858937.1 nuclear pore complex protein Nup93-1-like [Metopolophium dirhodum]
MATSDLDYLLLQGQTLCKDTDTFKPVTKIHKSLRQLCQNADHAPKQSNRGNGEQCAKEFLANRGIDLSGYSNVLKKLCTLSKNAITPCDSKPVMDYSSSVESLMGRHIEDYINNLEANDNKDSDNYLQDHLTSWKNIKKDIVYNEFASDSYDVSFCLQNLLTTKNTYFTFDPSLNSPNELDGNFLFIWDVQAYINQKECGNNELIEFFLETIHKNKATNAPVKHIWNVVKYMYNIIPQQSPYGSFNERFSEENQTNLVKNAKSYLEDKYQAFLVKETRHLNIANDGNYMAAIISSYVFINTGRPASQLNDFHVDEQSIWPLLYFSLRCGRMDVATYFIKKSGLALDELLSVFVHLKEANFTERVSSNISVTLNKYYRTLPMCDNAFRKIIFSLLGVVEANIEKKAMSKTIEDKLWMLLVEHFASKYMEDPNGLDYCSLQRYILDNGKHYMDQPHVYFELLFLIGQFESAIDFLYHSIKFSNHAVHIAIALNEKHLLATPEYLQAPFLSNENVDTKFVLLNYTRLILLFCNKFQSTHPRYATYYYYFLRNVKSPTLTENLFHKCVADLATTFDGDMCYYMFGCMAENKNFTVSILHDIFDYYTVTAIIDKTLELTLEINKLEVAFKLYSFTSKYKAAYGVLNSILSFAIYNYYDVFDQAMTDDKCKIVNKNFYDRVYSYLEEYNNDIYRYKIYLKEEPNISPNLSTFHVLRNMYLFFYYSSKYEFLLAIEKASDTGLVPLTSEDAKRCLNNCTNCDEIIQRNINNLIKLLVSVLCKEHSKILKHQNTSIKEDLLIEEVDNDVFDQSTEVGWTIWKLQKTIRVIYLFTAKLPVHIALDAVEYISNNASNMQLG